MEITQEQIEQLIQVGNEKTKELLNEWFGIKIEPHVWYYYKGIVGEYFLAYSDVKYRVAYGFINGNWFGTSDFAPKHDFRLATQEEVEPLLIAEAKKRGYKNGNYECLSGWGTDYIADENKYIYEHEGNQLWQGKNVNNKIYEKGNWAEIIPTMTIEEAEKKLNCRIIK